MSRQRRPSLWQRTDVLQAAVLIRSVARVTRERAAALPVAPVPAERVAAAAAEVVGEYQARGSQTGRGVVVAVADTLGQPAEQVWHDIVLGLTPDGATMLAERE